MRPVKRSLPDQCAGPQLKSNNDVSMPTVSFSPVQPAPMAHSPATAAATPAITTAAAPTSNGTLTQTHTPPTLLAPTPTVNHSLLPPPPPHIAALLPILASPSAMHVKPAQQTSQQTSLQTSQQSEQQKQQQHVPPALQLRASVSLHQQLTAKLGAMVSQGLSRISVLEAIHLCLHND